MASGMAFLVIIQNHFSLSYPVQAMVDEVEAEAEVAMEVEDMEVAVEVAALLHTTEVLLHDAHTAHVLVHTLHVSRWGQCSLREAEDIRLHCPAGPPLLWGGRSLVLGRERRWWHWGSDGSWFVWLLPSVSFSLPLLLRGTTVLTMWRLTLRGNITKVGVLYKEKHFWFVV